MVIWFWMECCWNKQCGKDHTLIRKCNISQGNSDWSSSAGTDSLNSEWIFCKTIGPI